MGVGVRALQPSFHLGATSRPRCEVCDTDTWLTSIEPDKPGAKMADCYENYISEQTDRKIFGTEPRLFAFLCRRGVVMER
jgi:hypothetical protein